MIRKANFIKAGQRGGNFRQLHQADRALHHARAAGAGNNHERAVFLAMAASIARVTFSPTTAPIDPPMKS